VQKPMLRVLPSHESLEPGEFLRRQIDDGLIENFDLALFERLAQIVFNLNAAIAIAAHARLENLDAIRTALFSAIHRQLGFLEQLVVSRLRAVPYADPYRAGQNDFLICERDGSSK